MLAKTFFYFVSKNKNLLAIISHEACSIRSNCVIVYRYLNPRSGFLYSRQATYTHNKMQTTKYINMMKTNGVLLFSLIIFFFFKQTMSNASVTFPYNMFVICYACMANVYASNMRHHKPITCECNFCILLELMFQHITTAVNTNSMLPDYDWQFLLG